MGRNRAGEKKRWKKKITKRIAVGIAKKQDGKVEAKS